MEVRSDLAPPKHLYLVMQVPCMGCLQDHLMGACIDAIGGIVLDPKLLPMEQTCRVGPRSDQELFTPASWRANSEIKQWLKKEMVTCHRVDAENMISMYSLMPRRIRGEDET